MATLEIIKRGDPGYSVKFLAAVGDALSDLYEHCNDKCKFMEKFKLDEIAKLDAELAKDEPNEALANLYREHINDYQLRLEAFDAIRKSFDNLATEVWD